MLNLVVCFTVSLLLIHKSYADIHTTNLIQEVKWLSTPQDFGSFLQVTLAQNDSKFISKPCLYQLKLYSKALFSLRLWAIEIFDASAKIPSGLLSGHGAALGAFDQCLRVHNTNLNIRGKYCLGRIPLLSLANSKSINNNSVAGDTPFGESRLLDLPGGSLSLPWGVCLPNQCSARDFQFLHMIVSMRFSEDSCQTADAPQKQLDGGDYTALIILGLFCILLTISTAYDGILRLRPKYNRYPLLQSFSIISNGTKILTSKEQANDISCLHGLKVISLILTVYVLTFVIHLLSPLHNWLDLVSWLVENKGKSTLEVLISGDTFFVISGLLVSYNYLNRKASGRRFNIAIYYLHRFMRLTPALAIAILVHATLLRYYGSGPVWPGIRDYWMVNNCREYWWSSLFYLQNYVNPDVKSMCMLQTWQISADMHLFLLSPILLYPLYKSPKFTLFTIMFFLICTFLSPFLVAAVYKISLSSFQAIDNLDAYIKNYFLPTHTRASSWLIGFLLGYFVFQTRNTRVNKGVKRRLNNYLVLLLWILSLGTLLLCYLIGCKLIHESAEWINHAFHMAVVRPAWSIAIAWIIFACAIGYGGPVNTFLSASIFKTLSAISYSTYILSLSIMFMLAYQSRSGMIFTQFNVLRNLCVNAITCFGVGFVWTLAFESPMISVGKILLKYRTREDEAITVDQKKYSQKSIKLDV